MMASSITDTIRVTQPEPTLHVKLQLQNQNVNVKPVPPPGAPVARMRKIKLDPSRALEPARKKIATIEAQRVMSVFEETIRRTEIITLLPHIISNLDRFRVSLGSELIDLLQHHQVIQDSYNEIRSELDKYLEKQTPSHSARSKSYLSGKSSRKSSTPGGQVEDNEEEEDENSQPPSRRSSASSRRSAEEADAMLEEIIRNLSLVAQQLSFSCKNILRAFQVNPAASNTVIAEYRVRNDECKHMVITMQELRDILMGKLLTTPEEEKERMAYLAEISQRERYNAGVIEKLEAELKSGMEDRDEEIRKKNEVIRRLQADLHQIEKFSEEHIRRVKTEAEKQETADVKNSEGKRQKLQQEINQLRTSFQTMTTEHRESEQELRKKKFKVETEVENWIQKYDQDMGERQDEYEEIDEIYTEEKKQLHELEERFKTLETEYKQIQEERRLARERREKAEQEMARMIRAATTVQAFWRSYKVRKALKAKKKKGGGKKGKKGKK
ncbi:hypothetical protein SNE40_003732 [Patella caerulea]|uniref:Dynein regulatory complex protein 10 n=2 Tax=Patella caerulea TaxID=87958 RepID=A0AAN8KEU3_PATCE